MDNFGMSGWPPDMRPPDSTRLRIRQIAFVAGLSVATVLSAIPSLVFVAWLLGPGATAAECMADARRDNRLVESVLLDPLPPASVRSVARFGEVEPDGDCDSTQLRGRISALFDGMTAHEFALRLEADGWHRSDPPAGRPAWDSEDQPPGDGTAAPWVESDDDVGLGDRWGRSIHSTKVVFVATKSDRNLWVFVDRDGLTARADVRSLPQFVRSLLP